MPPINVDIHVRHRQELLHQQALTLNPYQIIANTQYKILHSDISTYRQDIPLNLRVLTLRQCMNYHNEINFLEIYKNQLNKIENI